METEWTDQTAFDAAYVHCMEQEVRAMGNGLCLYRGPNGTKCAIGCLIPDNLYRKGMEGDPASDVAESLGWELNPHLVDCIQEAHDNLLSQDNLSPFRNQMKTIAGLYGLEWNHD